MRINLARVFLSLAAGLHSPDAWIGWDLALSPTLEQIWLAYTENYRLPELSEGTQRWISYSHPNHSTILDTEMCYTNLP